MRRKEAATIHSAQIARVASPAAFLASLALATALAAVPAAAAETAVPEPDPLALEEGLESEEEAAEEACIEAEDAFEAGEIDEAEVERICEEAEGGAEEEAAADRSASLRCPLRSARAHAVTRRGWLKLTIGYTTTEPVNATIQLHKGSVRIRTFKRHLGKSGVLRFAKKLGKRRRGRLVVRIALPSAQWARCPSRRLVLFPR